MDNIVDILKQVAVDLNEATPSRPECIVVTEQWVREDFDEINEKRCCNRYKDADDLIDASERGKAWLNGAMTHISITGYYKLVVSKDESK